MVKLDGRKAEKWTKGPNVTSVFGAVAQEKLHQLGIVHLWQIFRTANAIQMLGNADRRAWDMPHRLLNSFSISLFSNLAEVHMPLVSNIGARKGRMEQSSRCCKLRSPIKFFFHKARFVNALLIKKELTFLVNSKNGNKIARFLQRIPEALAATRKIKDLRQWERDVQSYLVFDRNMARFFFPASHVDGYSSLKQRKIIFVLLQLEFTKSLENQATVNHLVARQTVLRSIAGLMVETLHYWLRNIYLWRDVNASVIEFGVLTKWIVFALDRLYPWQMSLHRLEIFSRHSFSSSQKNQ